jgi:hypothetical protein
MIYLLQMYSKFLNYMHVHKNKFIFTAEIRVCKYFFSKIQVLIDIFTNSHFRINY